MAYSMEKDTYTCDFCGMELKWNETDERRGTMWGCEKCEKHFCSACFQEMFGFPKYQAMMQNSPLVLCPNCYAKEESP